MTFVMKPTWRESFDAADPGPTWSKITTHDSKELCNHGSRLVEAYAKMFRATGDPVYLTKGATAINTMFATAQANQWVRPGAAPAFLPAWTSTNESTNKSVSTWLEHDGMILSAIAYWCETVVSASVEVGAQFGASLADFSLNLKAWVQRWDAEYRSLPGGGGCFVMPAWQSHYAGVGPGVSLPYNMTNGFARFLYLYSKLSGDTTARAWALGCATTMRAAVTELWNGNGRAWKYAGHLLPTDPARYTGEPWTDSSHATVDIGFLFELAQDGLGLGPRDWVGLAFEARHAVLRSNGTLASWIDGSAHTAIIPDPDTNLSQWPLLGKYDPTIFAQCKTVLQNQAASLGGGTLCLALANMALYAPK